MRGMKPGAAVCLTSAVILAATPKAATAVRPATDLHTQAQEISEKQLARFGEGYWARIDRQRHIVYVSALDETHLRQTLHLLTAFTDAFRRTLPVSKPAWNVTVILPTADDYHRLAKPFADCVGYYSHRPRQLISIDRGRTLLHEFTHALHHVDAAAAKQSHPLWVAEGLATLFESSRITPEGLMPRTDGRLLTLRRALRDDKAIPLHDLLTMGRSAFMKDAALTYAEARYVMYYLHHRDRLADWYRRYKAAFERDPDGVKTFEAALGNRLFLIEPAWQKWVLSLRMPRMERSAQQGRLGLAVKNHSRGVEVVGMVPGSAAKLAGRIRVGDVIEQFNGRAITNPVELTAAVRAAGAMQTVTVHLIRHGRRTTVLQPLGAPDAH